MSRNYYSEINLHFTWHCKDSGPMLTPQVEPVTHRIIKDRLSRNPVNGVDITKERDDSCSRFGQPGINAGPTTG